MRYPTLEMLDRHAATGTYAPPVLYHWSPTENRARIDEVGLRPGSPANLVDWTPEWLCYAETPSDALALTLLDGPLDLWMIRTAGVAFWLANDGQEWRTREPISAWWCATRDALSNSPGLHGEVES